MQGQVFLLWMVLFSWVPIFVDQRKVMHSGGSKFVAIIISYITHTENTYLLLLEFVDWTLHEKHENWYPTKIKPFTVSKSEIPCNNLILV